MPPWSSPSPDPGVQHADGRRREYTLYDALAGQTDRTGRYRKRPPDELLFRRQRAPTRYEEHDIYRQHIHLDPQALVQLPDSDLLKATHTYASDYLAARALRIQELRSATYGRTHGSDENDDTDDEDARALIEAQARLQEVYETLMGRAKALAQKGEAEKSSSAYTTARVARRKLFHLKEKGATPREVSTKSQVTQQEDYDSSSNGQWQNDRPECVNEVETAKNKRKRKASQDFDRRQQKKARSEDPEPNNSDDEAISGPDDEEAPAAEEPKFKLTNPNTASTSYATLLSSHRSLDGTALLAMGILLEEAARETVRGRGDTVLTEGLHIYPSTRPRRLHDDGIAVGILGRRNVERLILAEPVGGPRRRDGSVLPEYADDGGNETGKGEVFDTDAGDGETEWDTAAEELQTAWVGG